MRVWAFIFVLCLVAASCAEAGRAGQRHRGRDSNSNSKSRDRSSSEEENANTWSSWFNTIFGFSGSSGESQSRSQSQSRHQSRSKSNADSNSNSFSSSESDSDSDSDSDSGSSEYQNSRKSNSNKKHNSNSNSNSGSRSGGHSITDSPIMQQKVIRPYGNPRKVCVTVHPVSDCPKGTIAIRSGQEPTQVRCKTLDSSTEARAEVKKMQKKIEGGESITLPLKNQMTIRVEMARQCSVVAAQERDQGQNQDQNPSRRSNRTVLDFSQPDLESEVQAVINAQPNYEHNDVTPTSKNLTQGFYGVQCPPDVAAKLGVQLSCAADCVAAHNQFGGKCGDASKNDFNCYCNPKIFENIQLLPLIRQNCPVQCHSKDRKKDYDELCRVDCLCNHGARDATCNYKTKACKCIGKSSLEEQQALCPFNSTLAMADYLNDLKLPNVEFGRQLENGTIEAPPALIACNGILSRVLFNVTGM